MKFVVCKYLNTIYLHLVICKNLSVILSSIINQPKGMFFELLTLVFSAYSIQIHQTEIAYNCIKTFVKKYSQKQFITFVCCYSPQQHWASNADSILFPVVTWFMKVELFNKRLHLFSPWKHPSFQESLARPGVESIGYTSVERNHSFVAHGPEKMTSHSDTMYQRLWPSMVFVSINYLVKPSCNILCMHGYLGCTECVTDLD